MLKKTKPPPKKNFKCEKCGKRFNAKHHLEKHLNKKNACDQVHQCSKCQKTFPNPSELKRHENRITSCAPESVPIVTNDNEENKCYMCGNEYSSPYNLKRHLTTCAVAKNPSLLMNMIINDNMELKKEVAALRSQISETPQTVINGDVNIQNNVLNNTYVNVTLCGFGQEDLSKLDQNKVMNLLKNSEEDFMPQMIENVYANSDMPENHNVFFDSNCNKAIVYVAISEHEKSWQAQDFEEVLKQITKKIKTYMKPGNSPYFDLAMKERDYDTSNIIIRVADQTDWNTSEVFEKAKVSLSKISKNKEFMKQVTIED